MEDRETDIFDNKIIISSSYLDKQLKIMLTETKKQEAKDFIQRVYMKSEQQRNESLDTGIDDPMEAEEEEELDFQSPFLKKLLSGNSSVQCC